MHTPGGILTLTQNLKKLQITQNKCICFCLKLDKMHHNFKEYFKTINWLPDDQSLSVALFKYVNN